jgi:hypothetical protein
VVFALILGAMVVTLVLAAITIDVFMCLIGRSPSPPPPPPSGSGSGLTAEMDCPTAQQLLADAKAKLTRLQAEIDAQGLRIQAALGALMTARMAMTAAFAGLAGSFFFPWMLPAALAAFAVATFMATSAARQLETEAARLRRLVVELADAQREVAAYEGVVSQACRTTVVPTPPVGGITVTTLMRVIGTHER